MNRQEVIDKVREEGIRFIRLQFTDIFGQLKTSPSPPPSWKKR